MRGGGEIESDLLGSFEDLWDTGTAVGSNEGLKETLVNFFKFISRIFHKVIDLLKNLLNAIINKQKASKPSTTEINLADLKSQEERNAKKKELLDKKKELEASIDNIFDRMKNIPTVPKDESSLYGCCDSLQKLIEDFDSEVGQGYGAINRLTSAMSAIQEMINALKAKDEDEIYKYFHSSIVDKSQMISAANPWQHGGNFIKKLLDKCQRVAYNIDNFKYDETSRDAYWIKDGLNNIQKCVSTLNEFATLYTSQFNRWETLRVRGRDLYWELINIEDQLRKLER